MRYREFRWPCDYPVRLSGSAWDCAARVVNVHLHGARVDCDRALEPGGQLRMIVPGATIEAEVRWVRGRFAGLRFDRPLTARQLGLLRKADAPRLRGTARPSALTEMG